MQENRLHFAQHGLAGALGVVLALGTMALPATAAPVDDSRAPDVSVVELDLTGVAWAELDDLPDAPPMPPDQADGAAQVDGASLALPPPVASPRVLPATFAGSHAGDAAGAVLDTAGSSPTPSAAAPGEVPPGQEDLPDVLTPPLATAKFSVLGLTWDEGAEGVVLRYRVRTDGEWSPWEAVGESDVSPDKGGADDRGGGRRAADAVVALGADGLQVWAEAEAGTVAGLKAVLIDPGTAEGDTQLPAQPAVTSWRSGSAAPSTVFARGEPSSGDARIVTAESSAGRSNATTVVPAASYPAPTIITRAQWGADESLRNCEPDLSTSMVSAAVHHTATTNTYSPADVPGLVRGIYAFHTRPEGAGGRGWCDIGYNFLVDRFGRVFEGRAGSIDKTVVGAHTGGFNSRTVGVSAIGEYGAVAAPDVLLEAISQTIAWKFSQLRVRGGNATVTMVSGGSTSKYPAGTVVTFPTIYGHRDAGLTSCPGQLLYDRLPAIRARVAQLVDAGVSASPFGSWDRTTVTEGSVEVAGWIHDPDTRSPIRLAVVLNGRRTEAVADGPRPDVAAAVPTAGPAHGFALRLPIGAGRSVLCLWALNVSGGYDTTLGCRHIQPPTPSGPPLEQAQAFVRQAYRDILGREADPGGLQSWSAAVHDGWLSRRDLTMALIRSREGTDRATAALYRQVLGREPDPSGLAGWSSALGDGLRFKDVRAAFWSSGERLARSGTTQQWVADFYLVELRRPTDPGGAAFWTATAQQRGPQVVAAGIISSPEWSGLTVESIYQQMLHRASDPGGKAGWAQVLAASDTSDVLAAFGASEEYFARALAAG